MCSDNNRNSSATHMFKWFCHQLTRGTETWVPYRAFWMVRPGSFKITCTYPFTQIRRRIVIPGNCWMSINWTKGYMQGFVRIQKAVNCVANGLPRALGSVSLKAHMYSDASPSMVNVSWPLVNLLPDVFDHLVQLWPCGLHVLYTRLLDVQVTYNDNQHCFYCLHY